MATFGAAQAAAASPAILKSSDQQQPVDAAAACPWLPACSRWSVTAPGHLSTDIEDLHEAACGGGGSGTYDDPQTGFMVFTAAALSKRKSCCANRCRHCPFGHYKVQGPRPRVNRLTQPALLQPSPGTRRVAASGAGAAAPSGGAGAESGPEAGVTLVVYEGDAASEALARMMAGAVAAAPSASPAAARGVGCLPQPSAPFVAGQRLALLAAFDVDTGRLWGPAGDPSTAAAAAALRAGSGADSDADGGSGSGGDVGAAMDASLRDNLDLVAVPLQVSGRSWQRDPAVAGEALTHVLTTAARLMQVDRVERVVVSRPEDGTPALFAPGTRGCVAGGWEALVQRANSQLQQQQR
eukprot:XP_001698012.1 predicted protein [Chlamydomonas reinhardtii]